MVQKMDNISRKQTAKKGWVTDVVNNSLSKLFTFMSQHMGSMESNLLNRIDIVEEVLIQKLNITRDDLNKMITVIDERNKKDNSIIEKYISKEDIEAEEKLKLMIEEGLSPKGQDYAKHIISQHKEKEARLEEEKKTNPDEDEKIKPVLKS